MIPKKCVVFVTEEKDIAKNFEITTQEEAGKCNAMIFSKGEGGVRVDESTGEDSNELGESQTEISNFLDKWLKTGECCSS